MGFFADFEFGRENRGEEEKNNVLITDKFYNKIIF